MANNWIPLSEIELNICTGCEWCVKNNDCHYDDGISIIMEKMKNAEGIILGSPSWNYNVTSYMKIFLDRLFSLFNFGRGSWSSELGNRGIKAILIGVCAAPDESSMGFTIEAMRKVMVDHGVEVLIEETYLGTRRNPVETNQEIKNDIRKKLNERIANRYSHDTNHICKN